MMKQNARRRKGGAGARGVELGTCARLTSGSDGILWLAQDSVIDLEGADLLKAALSYSPGWCFPVLH